MTQVEVRPFETADSAAVARLATAVQWPSLTDPDVVERVCTAPGSSSYVATAGVNGDHARVASGSDYWGKMHDPFDPKFRQDLDRSLRGVVERVKGDPWCVGYFVDNELSWGRFDPKDASGRVGLAIGALQAGADSPAHRAILDDLRTKYGTIEKLNAAWATDVKSWDTLGADGWAPRAPYGEALAADLTAFVTRLARVRR